jgi:small GTP-binding protein
MQGPFHKVILLGFTGVGKSQLLNAFDSVPGSKGASVAIAIRTVQMQFLGRPVTLQIWDTSGQERFEALSPIYTRDADCAIIVFALNSPASWTKVAFYHQLAEEQRVQQFVIVGNKADLEPVVVLDEVRLWCREHGFRFIQTSAVEGRNVRHLFQSVTEIVADRDPRVPGLRIDTEGRGIDAPCACD